WGGGGGVGSGGERGGGGGGEKHGVRGSPPGSVRPLSRAPALELLDDPCRFLRISASQLVEDSASLHELAAPRQKLDEIGADPALKRITPQAHRVRLACHPGVAP